MNAYSRPPGTTAENHRPDRLDDQPCMEDRVFVLTAGQLARIA
jgi:hypothetical protein